MEERYRYGIVNTGAEYFFTYHGLESNKKYPVRIWGAYPSGNLEEGLDASFLCEFADGKVLLIYCGHVTLLPVSGVDVLKLMKTEE